MKIHVAFTLGSGGSVSPIALFYAFLILTYLAHSRQKQPGKNQSTHRMSFSERSQRGMEPLQVTLAIW